MNSTNEKTMTRKKAFTPVSFNTTPQRTPKFPDPEKYGRAREELESFKYAFRAKFRANYDWYPTKDMRFDYAFSCLKNVVRTQMLFKMNERNVLKFYSVEKLLRFLNVNFGDQNKKQTAQNKIRFLTMGKKPFAEYLAEFQQHIKNTGFDIDNQKYSFLIGCSWELQKFLVQHDIDRMTFDEIIFICQILWIKNQLANQAKPKNYSNFTHPVLNSNASPTSNTFPVRGYITPSITTFVQPPAPVPIDQGDPMDLSASKGLRKPFTPEERKYRFDNNLCLYCGKPGHRIMDHKITTQRINFVTPAPIVKSPTKTPFAIEPPLFHNNNKKLNFASSRLQKLLRFFISVLTLAPANSVEISNKHLFSRCTVEINELFDYPITLFDTGVTGEIFMDKKYAQQQGIPSIFLIRPIPLQGFDGNFTGSGPVTHFAYLLFVPPNHKPQFTRFFLTDIPQFPIIISLPWMKSKFTTIRFKPDISTINFEQLDEMNEPVTTPEIMETNSLTEISNS